MLGVSQICENPPHLSEYVSSDLPASPCTRESSAMQGLTTAIHRNVARRLRTTRPAATESQAGEFPHDNR